MGIITLFSTLLIVIAPYKKSIDNIRLILYRLFLVVLNSLQIGFKLLRNDYAQRSSFVYDYSWILLVVLILIVSALFLPFSIYQITLILKRNNKNDAKLIDKDKNIRPDYPFSISATPTYYPPLEFSVIFKKSDAK